MPYEHPGYYEGPTITRDRTMRLNNGQHVYIAVYDGIARTGETPHIASCRVMDAVFDERIKELCGE